MSGNEIYTRGHQEFSKRWEFALYRLGYRNGVMNHYRATTSAGSFFFALQDLAAVAGLLHEQLPETVATTVREADEICCHRFRLLGHDKVDLGPEIDWHLDAINNKRAPLRPWYKIPFLEFSVVGDHKIIWELNRHQHLVTLAKAWVLTHDDKYRDELARQWYSWQLANPFPLGINWASSLEIGFRTLSWLWVEALLGDAQTTEFRTNLVGALSLNGRHIERYLSTYFSPNTHLLGEAVALFFLGTVHPEIADAQRWRDSGWRIVVQEAERQVRSDGFHFEHSPYYHVYALDLFLHARVLAARNGIPIPADFDTTLKKMLHALSVLTQAGPANGFGDDDGGRVFDPRRNRGEHLRDPLALGTVLFSEFGSATPITEEAVWLFGEKVIARSQATPSRPTLQSTRLDASGIYVTASPCNDGEQMIINAGRWGGGRGGHCHADALAVTVSCWGRPWLVDPGTYSYASSSSERDQFRGTRAHNTLTVDGLHQSDPAGPFAWAAKPEVRTERWVEGKNFSLFAGNHSGYCRLPDPVLVRRLVFHLHGQFWFVHDTAEGQGQHRIESSWHFAPDLQLQKSDGSYIVSEASPRATSSPRLAVVGTDSEWTYELGVGEFSPAYGKKEKAPLLRAITNGQLPMECALLIQPRLSSARPGKLTRLSGNSVQQGVFGYQYDELNRATLCILFSRRQGTWKIGDWSSDAHFVYFEVKRGELTAFFLCGGTLFHVADKPVFESRQSIERFEWTNESDVEVSSPECRQYQFSKVAFEIVESD